MSPIKSLKIFNLVLCSLRDVSLTFSSFARYNIVLSGTLLLGVNETNQSAVIEGGAHGLILVTDIEGTGHSAGIGPDAPAVVVMLPIKDDIVPAHTVLHDGQCLECEMNF